MTKMRNLSKEGMDDRDCAQKERGLCSIEKLLCHLETGLRRAREAEPLIKKQETSPWKARLETYKKKKAPSGGGPASGIRGWVDIPLLNLFGTGLLIDTGYGRLV